MAPIRRYLRITKYSVLECRIYLDNPALAHSWLLNPRDPILPRVVEAVRPLVLPKLEEEKERDRNRRKGAKKRSIKDVVTTDEFEVAIFLTETNTRHSLLFKQKRFRDKTQTKLISNSSRLVGASSEAPIDVDGSEFLASEMEETRIPGLRREDSDENGIIALENIPSFDDTAGAADEEAEPAIRTRQKRGRYSHLDHQSAAEVGDYDDSGPVEVNANADGLFVSSDSNAGSDDEHTSETRRPRSKRRKEDVTVLDMSGLDDDKKKMAMDISYDGFAIYGRVLCLVVKRRDGAGARLRTGPANRSRVGGGEPGQPAGQASMESWITSTQMPADAADDLGMA